MSTNHILPLPKAILPLRIVQLVTAVAILGLAAYGVTYLSFDGDDLTLFTAITTMIITVYYIVAVTGVTAAYNYWAILGLDIFAIVFWIISFSLLASEVAAYSWVVTNYSTCSYNYYGYCVKKRDLSLEKRDTNIYTYRNAMAAASGLGGLEFILFVVTLVFTSIHIHRHRAAGGHCMPNSLATAPVSQERKNDVELQGQGYNGTNPNGYYPPQQEQQVVSA